jgi:hypothetical protein
MTRKLKEREMKVTGCGKQLQIGDRAVNRWGKYLCLDCDKRHPHPILAVYTQGVLLKPIKCGGVAK